MARGCSGTVPNDIFTVLSSCPGSSSLWGSTQAHNRYGRSDTRAGITAAAQLTGDACQAPVQPVEHYPTMAKPAAEDGVFEGTNHLELIAVCVLIVSVSLHSLLLYIQKITRRHRNVAQMLDRMYRELMILGLISTILYFCEASNLFSHDEVVRIHQIHLTLFFTVIGWVFTSILLLSTSIYISFTWNKSEEAIPQLLSLQSELERIKAELAETAILLRPFYVTKWLRKNEIESFLSYAEVRQQFIDSNHLPKGYNFGYYLRKCKRHVFLTLGGIHTSAWIAVAFVLLLDMMYRNYIALLGGIPKFMRNFEYYANGALIFVSSIVTALALIVFYKCKRVLKTLQDSDMIKFDALANNYMIRSDFDDALNDDLEFDEDSAFIEKTRSARVYSHDKWVNGNDSRNVIQGVAIVLSDYRYEYRPNRQQELFWFGSHLVLLRFIQSILATMIITCSIMVSHYVAGGEVLFRWTPIILIVMFILVFMSIASAIPIYTIIVHIGELADIKTAREAARKIEQRRHTARQIKLTEQIPRATFSQRLERILISSWMESLIQWLIIVNVLAVAVPLVFAENEPVNIVGDVITLSITSFFLLEVIVRGSILGFSYFLIDWWTIVDCVVVLASFLAAVVQFWYPVIDITTVLLGMRLLESGRVWRIARKIKRARAAKQYQQRHPDPWDYSKDESQMQASKPSYIPEEDSERESSSEVDEAQVASMVPRLGQDSQAAASEVVGSIALSLQRGDAADILSQI